MSDNMECDADQESDDEQIRDELYIPIVRQQRRSREYRTDFEKRGKVIIVDFHEFEKKRLPSLDFSHVDVLKLQSTFEALQFVPEVWNEKKELSKQAFFKKIDTVLSDPDNEEYECFAMVIMTHGEMGGKLHAYDGTFNIKDVCSKFAADKCRCFAGKPKLFFVHACRGSRLSKAALAYGHERDAYPEEFSVPAESDLLVMYSTYEGKVAFAGDHTGSVFVNALTSVLEEDINRDDQEKEHILDLMTQVSSETAAAGFEGNNTHEIYKQQPTIVSTLLQFYYLKKKTSPEVVP